MVIIVVVGAIGFPAFFYFYKAPTCFDGKRNGGEQGIDCGGSCVKLCASAFLSPKIDWTRYEEIAPGVYNLAAYIENPNTEAVAVDVPFHMALYDAAGIKISDTSGMVTLPPHRNTLAFLPAVRVGQSSPAAMPFFEFTAGPDWNKQVDPLIDLVVGEKQFTDESAGASLQVALQNIGVQKIPSLKVNVILYDKDNNAIGFSQTVVDGIAGKGGAMAPFTWPTGFGGKVISEEILPVAE